MHVEDLRPLDIFAGLTDDQLSALAAGGDEVLIQPELELFRQGEPADFWWLLVDGAVDLVRRVGREDAVVARMDQPGRWAGGFRAWDEHGTYLATGRGKVPGRLLRVPSEVLRDWANTWFPFGGQLIRGLYHTARSIESTVRQRESLVSLGTLAAGLAHELNNPAAAAARSTASLQDASRHLLSVLDDLGRQDVSARDLLAVNALQSENGGAPAGLDPLDRADLEQVVGAWLSDHGVERAWTIAPALVSAGADLEWCARAETAVPGAALSPAVDWVATTYAIRTLLTEVAESTRRISELVAAVRSYSQLDRGSMQRIEVTEGLESTLVMLGHRLRLGRIEVARNYSPEVPPIDAYAGELNQVWTILIVNALDAMDETGVLSIATRVENDRVLVEIADTGGGMTPEVAARAFDAFFTTKDVGEGTGLGLDIARRIVVEHHGGVIDIVGSGPTGTVVGVQLPTRQS